MANTAYPPVIWVNFVILVAGRAFLDASPGCPGTPKVGFNGNTISDPKIKTDQDIHLIQRFLSANQLPSDDSFMALTRVMNTICPIQFPKRKTTSKSVKKLIKANLDAYTKVINDKITKHKGTIDDYPAPKSRFTRDHSDILARRATIFRTKSLAHQLRSDPTGSDPDNAAEPQVTDINTDATAPGHDHIRTDISLDDSFGQAMGNLNSQVLSPVQLDTTINELGTRQSYAKAAKSPPAKTAQRWPLSPLPLDPTNVNVTMFRPVVFLIPVLMPPVWQKIWKNDHDQLKKFPLAGAP